MILPYLRYVVRHKRFVFVAGLRLGVPIRNLIVHDWSKFLPGEFFPYARYFYGPLARPWSEVTAYEKTHYFDSAWRASKEGVKEAFNAAWLKHLHRNPHHWQYWLLRNDDGSTLALRMPDRFMREMVADWTGAGQALGKPDIVGWYLENRHKMVLHPTTQHQVEVLLAVHQTAAVPS